jgi:CheY-like chemotaxis protein
MKYYPTTPGDLPGIYNETRFLAGHIPWYEMPVAKVSKVKKSFDLSLVEEMDDNEYLLDMLSVFLAKTPGEFDELRKACDSRQFEAVHSIAHKLKSSAGLFKAEQLLDLLTKIEHAAKARNGDGFSDLCSGLTEEFKEIEIPLLQRLASVQLLLRPVTQQPLIVNTAGKATAVSFFKAMKILIVDDHSIVRKGLRQLLMEAFPFSVIDECVNAEEVIKKTIEYTYDVVICDLSMPGRSGMDILQQLNLNFPKMPVLILSMHPEDLYAIRALKAGAAGYLNKEFASEELVKAVNKVLQGQRYISPFIAEKMADELNNGCDQGFT